MKKYKARVVEILHEERKVTFQAVEGCSPDELAEMAIQAACDDPRKAKLIGVMDRIANDIEELK